jgi:hypothetical protein
MANLKDILTLGIFDYSKVVDLLAGSFKKSVNPTVTENQTNSLINILKPQNAGDEKINVRLAQAWRKYWDCRLSCLTGGGRWGTAQTENWLSGCYTEGSPYSPCQSEPQKIGGFLKNVGESAPKLPGEFPCCSECAAKKCLERTGNTDCSGDPAFDPASETLLLLMQVLCQAEAEQQWEKDLNCWECLQNGYAECTQKCTRPCQPPCPEPSRGRVTERLIEEGII